MAKQKRYNRRGWYALSEELKVNRAGHGYVHLSESGSVLSSQSAGETSLAASGATQPPSDDRYLFRRFRMLSKVLIEGHWVDFSEGDVLKRAVPLFLDLTIYADHRPSVRNWIGVVLDPEWTESLNDRSIPGVDGNFRIDRVQNPDIARGIDQNPPAIKCCSVGIHFKYRRSHSEMSDWQFYEMLGREVDGQVVRFIVTEITRVVEVSLVYAGADRNAIMLSTDEYDDFNEDEEEPMPKDQTNSSSDELARLQSDLKEKSAELEKYSALGSIDELNEALAFRKAELERIRDSAEKAYRLARKDRVEERIVAMIRSADLDAARAFAAEYGGEVDATHPVKCGDCGSKNLTRASGQQSDTHTGKEDVLFIEKK